MGGRGGGEEALERGRSFWNRNLKGGVLGWWKCEDLGKECDGLGIPKRMKGWRISNR